jgi:holo-[acyl-carrier protein] synthase
MILGVGVDVVALLRVRALLYTSAVPAERRIAQFSRRILNTAERSEFVARSQTPDQLTRYLAVRWCIKEAAYKALYPHYTCTWHDLTITTTGKKPAVCIASPDIRLHASVSHDAGLVTAFVLAETSQPD